MKNGLVLKKMLPRWLNGEKYRDGRVRKFVERIRERAGCWEWTRGTNSRGYGIFWFEKRQQSAHRIAWTLTHGQIEVGLEIDHLCRNHGCVNADHLEVVPHRVNILRGTGFSARNAQKTHCPKGHSFAEYGQVSTWKGVKARVCSICKKAQAREFRRRRRLTKATS